MQLNATYSIRWLTIVALTVLFVSVCAFAYTGNYLLLPVPFAFLYIALLGINWKTAYWILLFCIPSSIQLSFSNDTMSITLPDEPMLWLFLLLFMLMWARKPDIIPKWWWRDPLVLIIVLQYLWFIIAVIYSQVLFFSIKYLIAKTWLMVCYFVFPVLIFREKKDFKKAFWVTFVPILITMIVIMTHHAFLHFAFDQIQHAMSGLYYNHVDYSTVISMFFPLLLVAYPLTKGKSKKLRGALLLVILFFLVAIFYSYARAAMIAIVFAAIVGLAIRYKLVNFIMPAIYGLMTLGLVYMTQHNKYLDYRPNYDQTYMHHDFTNHIMATFRGRDMSSMERLYRWIAGIRMSQDRPVTGYGPHAFYYYYKPYAVSEFKTWVSRNPEHSTTHNYFLYMLVEQGWPAMLLYATLLVVIFARAQKIYHRFKDKFYKLCTIGLAMTIAAGFINNFFSELIETHKVGALFYISVALLVILDKKSKDMEEGQTDIESSLR